MGLFKKSGGGFLNGVEGVINSVSFAYKTFTSQKGNDYSKLSAELLVTVDGAEEPVQQFVDAGFFYPDEMAISEDGRTIQGLDEDGNVVELEESPLREGTEFEKLVTSLIEGGFPVEPLGIGVNYSAVDGTRVRFKRVKDEEGTKIRGKRKGSNGKEYDRDFLLIDKVLALPEAKKAAGSKKATAGSKTATPRAGAKKAAAASDTGRADEILQSLVADADDNTIERKGLNAAFVRYALANKIAQDERKALQAQIGSDEYLTGAAERGLISLTEKEIGLP